jgi:hypothetical protein
MVMHAGQLVPLSRLRIPNNFASEELVEMPVCFHTLAAHTMVHLLEPLDVLPLRLEATMCYMLLVVYSYRWAQLLPALLVH